MSHAVRERRLARRVVYRGRILDLLVDRVLVPGHGRHLREVVAHRQAAAVVPCLADGRVVLVRQYRYAVGRFLWEIPAGLVDPGEGPQAAARRELAEETGYRAARWVKLAQVYSSPGFCRERVHLFLATGLRRPGRPRLDRDEALEARTFSPRQLRALTRAGRCVDAKTLLGLRLAGRA